MNLHKIIVLIIKALKIIQLRLELIELIFTAYQNSNG